MKEVSAQKIANAELAAKLGIDIFKFDKAINDTVRSVLGQELNSLDPRFSSRILQAQQLAINEAGSVASFKASASISRSIPRPFGS